MKAFVRYIPQSDSQRLLCSASFSEVIGLLPVNHGHAQRPLRPVTVQGHLLTPSFRTALQLGSQNPRVPV